MGQISIVLIAVGTALLVYYIHSLAPRRADVVLHIPVSLSPGHIRTGDVRVALDTRYYADIELDTAYSKRVGCDPYDVLATRWTLSDGEHVVEQGSSPWEDTGLTIGGLYSEKPLYSMDIAVLPGAGCLEAAHPRLKIQSRRSSNRGSVLLAWVLLLPLGTGITLLTRLWPQSTEKPLPRIFPEMVLGNVSRLQRHRPIPIMRSLPDFGLAWGLLLFVVMVVFMAGHHRAPRGLMVNFKWGNPPGRDSPWPETLNIYVDSERQFFVNGKQLPREHLRTGLTEELGRRVIWVVYFEADRGCLFMDATYAMDVIEGSGAKLIWITPQVREQLNATPDNMLQKLVSQPPRVR